MRQGGSTGEVVQLVENEDYYPDAGLMVLTARYHPASRLLLRAGLPSLSIRGGTNAKRPKGC